MNAAWLTAFTALAVAVATALVWMARQAWLLLRGTSRFLDDWTGRHGQPGVMDRLQAVESAVAKVLAETKPDHGHSLRDVLHQVREDVSDVRNDQAAMRARMEQFELQRQKRDDHA